jgi:hypothetical protein
MASREGRPSGMTIASTESEVVRVASARRQRKRERRALGRTEQGTEKIQARSTAARSRSTTRLCYRCASGCRTEKPLYGWVCANCAYELDRYFFFTLGLTGGDVVSAFQEAKRRGGLPAPGPRGRGVNVRKPWAIG